MFKTDCIKAPSFKERLLRLVYPSKCIFCGLILPESTKVMACDACYTALPRYHKGFEQSPNIPYSNGLFASFIYENEIEKAIHTMKFSNQPRYSETLSFLLFEEISKLYNIPDFDVIVPVPMHKRKQRLRGYNQSELISAHLGKFLNVQTVNLLLKVKHTQPQSLSGRSQRLANLSNAFLPINAENIKGKNILLVDDVATTGATLNTCAKSLYESGAAWIYSAVIAIAGK